MIWLKSSLSKTILFCCFHLSVVNAQDKLAEYQSLYPGHSEMILNETQKYNFSIQKNKLTVLQDNFYESMIISEMGIHNTTEIFSYSELVPLRSFDAYTLIQNKGKNKKIPVKQSTEKMSRQRNIFYDDVMQRKLTYSNLEIGAKKIYEYQTEFLDPYLLHKHIFASNSPIEKSALEVWADNTIEIGYKIFNDPNNEIQFKKTEKKGKTIYTWSLNNLNPIKYESNSPGFLHMAPHIIVYVKSYRANNSTVEVLGTIDQLYAYYRKFVETINNQEDTSLKKTTLELIEGISDEEEKIKTIFYWVKDNIKYVAFENGYEGFIPREAGLVYSRKFGDCKDMSSIITEMAKYAGVPNVNLCWIGTRRIPYGYNELATPAVDDHMIATYEKDGKIIFLDATSKETAYGLPTGFIQGKEALIGLGDTYKIVQVPVVDGKKNKISESIELSIQKNTLSGKGEMAIHGLSRNHYLSQLGDATLKNRFEKIKSLVIKGNNKFTLKNYTESNIENRELPHIVSFEFDLDNYLVEADEELYLNLFLDKPFEKTLIEKDRKAKFEFDFLMASHYDIKLHIPDHLSVKVIPKNDSFENDLMEYHIKYSFENNLLTLQYSVEIKKLLLETSDFDQWNQSVKNLKAHYNNSVILLKK